MVIFKKVMKITGFTLLGISVIFLALFMYVVNTVEPTVNFVRWAFNQTSYTPHENINVISSRVDIQSDITYPSKYGMNQLDVIVSKENNNNTKKPTIIWIHGGAFIAGDKTDVTEYMYVLADEGYVVVNMNYGLGNEFHYPAPLIQVSEVYDYLEKNQDKYPYVDINNIVIGGDSAGAFIAAQYTIIQTNLEYSKLVGIEQRIDKEDIKGVLLFCGPYDFGLLKNLLGNNKLKSATGFLTDVVIPFIANKIGEAFLGDKNWATNDQYDVLNLQNYVTADFPKVFLTDASTVSFQAHAEELAEELRALNVDVTTVFYEAKLTHEYQFNLSSIYEEDGRNYGMETLEKVLIFLEQTFE